VATTVTLSSCCCGRVDLPVGESGGAESDPKLGRVTIVLPPLTETPGTVGLPPGAFPAPPAPALALVEMPPWAEASEPLPPPIFPAPGPSPLSPLPEPLPVPMLAPLPVPPRPGLSPPEGESAVEPLLPVVGSPIFDPG